MKTRSVLLIGCAVALSLAACTQANDTAETVPETAATMAEGQNEATGAIEPGVGSPAEPGAGVPDASQPDVTPNPDGTNPVPPQPRDAVTTPPA
ncbi:hypothetical protein BZG35_12020 [Brevundimonas sp. LM2]|uniref:hypothetical protein n=1 Tax=Brevundimonas sp. LM2 TaxID=1938605 RepID=UPI000983AB8D|nr:hypothetical protein [Brevundimonas sp. LM2]AQR62290.1 hypothetical protein BZG35_12020 [Brevundimonas sp. LM2]